MRYPMAIYCKFSLKYKASRLIVLSLNNRNGGYLPTECTENCLKLTETDSSCHSLCYQLGQELVVTDAVVYLIAEDTLVVVVKELLGSAWDAAQMYVIINVHAFQVSPHLMSVDSRENDLAVIRREGDDSAIK